MRLKEVLLAPLLSQKRRLWGIVWSLGILSASQGLFLLLIQGFVTALFEPPVFLPGNATPEPIRLLALIPKGATAYLPDLSSYSFARMTLAWLVPVLILLAAFLRSYAIYAYQLNQQGLTLFLAKSYRERLFRALLSLPYAEIRRRSAGEWMSIIMNDVMFLQSRFNDVMVGVVRDGVSVAAGFVFLAIFHWPSALALALISPFIAYGMGRTGKRIARFADAFQRELGRLAASLLDIRSRYDFIRAQSGEALEEKRFGTLNERYYAIMRRSILVRSAFAPVLEFLGFTLFAGFLFLVERGQWGQGFSPDNILILMVALGQMLKPLRNLGEQLSRFEETRGSLKRSFETFDRLEALAERGHADTETVDAALTKIFAGKHAAQIERVTIGYALPEDKISISMVAEDIQLKAGWAVAIIGPSGAGKSTLIKTLAGLLRPQEWRGEISWQECAASSSMVSQDPFLFDDSIEANLTYGLSQKPSTESIWQALALVNIEREMLSLPQGLETRVRAIGSNLSGGQLQRLVIARSLLRQKSLYLLDEATSAVDAKSERDITLRLIDACHQQGIGLIAVTHRLQWLDAFDEVWFIEKGEIAWRGRHGELMANPDAARYQEFCQAALAPGEGEP